MRNQFFSVQKVFLVSLTIFVRRDWSTRNAKNEPERERAPRRPSPIVRVKPGFLRDTLDCLGPPKPRWMCTQLWGPPAATQRGPTASQILTLIKIKYNKIRYIYRRKKIQTYSGIKNHLDFPHTKIIKIILCHEKLFLEVKSFRRKTLLN